MLSGKKHFFHVGGEVSGDDFIGRKEILDKLSIVFSEDAPSVHLVGANCMGKSSLIAKTFEMNANTDNVIPIRCSLYSFGNAFEFWIGLYQKILSQVQKKSIFSKEELMFYEEIVATLDESTSIWYSTIKFYIEELLVQIGETGNRVVVAIDEFDRVGGVFGNKSQYYSELRSLFSEGQFAMNGIIASRRNLEVLADKAQATEVSNFSNVFIAFRVKYFNTKDMDEFYNRLADFGVKLDSGCISRFEHYTGRLPYLCCMLANKLIASSKNCSITVDLLDDIWLSLQIEVQSYYDKLIDKMRDDGHLEPLVLLAFGEIKTLSYEHNKNNMMQMGYLREEESDDSSRLVAYSWDFMCYLRHLKLNLPTHDLINLCENHLAKLVEYVFPEFVDFRFTDVNRGVNYKKVDELESIEYLLEWLPQLLTLVTSTIANGYRRQPAWLPPALP